MRIESTIFSLLLHGGVLALMLFRPGDAPVDLQRQSYQVSLVMGAPGGEELPSPVLGARPEKVPDPQPEKGADLPDTQPEAAPDLPALPETPPAPNAPPDQPSLVEIPDRTPIAVPAAPEPEAPAPEKKPEPEKEPELKETPPEKTPELEVPQKETPKEEPGKETPAPAKQPPKDQKKPDKPRRSALDDALADVRREARSSSGSSSASRALEELARETGVGGGGGSGTGPGGGGIYDVYVGQVILAVQPNWSMPTYSRENLVVGVRIKLAPDGKVLDCRIEQSSGRPDFDASAINAVLRTRNMPPPPTPAQQDLLISFNAQQLAGR